MEDRIDAKKWAEEFLLKQPKISHEEMAIELEEFIVLGKVIYDDRGNWIPQLTRDSKK